MAHYPPDAKARVEDNENHVAEHPPSYDDVHTQTQQPSAPEDLPTLILDGCQIYSSYSPSRILYELSNAPADASTTIYGIEKMRYRVAHADSEPSLTSRVDHIYDFKGDWMSPAERNVVLMGKTSQKRTYPKVVMSQGLTASSFKVEGMFKADPDMKGRLNQGRNNMIVWKDAEGQIVARETRLQRDKEKKVQDLPRLAIQATLEEKTFDLLVTCWCARVWKEAEKDLKEPLSWDKCLFQT
ncbi:hypothetical protein FZEAL_632 [Fusarium zealandicum]|uniref:Uncharacterized protein n=1 Tax=Fusarium zealandicum TaxID=1053134 RepID=A0A8H4UUS1_9HYPO|nr:hypothetical protein FZEAL_632 [Fusarium zealandicum]